METKEKFERAKRLYETANADQKYVLERLFPELAESEDERIRQLLISFVKYDMPDNYSDDFSKEDCLAWLEEQGEQKPIDKVEPKLKIEERKWYVCISQFCNCIEGRAYKATSDSRIMDNFGTEYDMHSDAYKYFRLWTIQDAKDGDVLADNVGVILFRKIGNEEYADVVDYHCAVFKSGGFVIQKGVSYWGYSKDETLRPTTLEQRVRFFDAMGEAGYAWDAVKKELKKIEQKTKSTWKPSEQDILLLERIANGKSDPQNFQASLGALIVQLKKLREEYL